MALCILIISAIFVALAIGIMSLHLLLASSLFGSFIAISGFWTYVCVSVLIWIIWAFVNGLIRGLLSAIARDKRVPDVLAALLMFSSHLLAFSVAFVVASNVFEKFQISGAIVAVFMSALPSLLFAISEYSALKDAQSIADYSGMNTVSPSSYNRYDSNYFNPHPMNIDFTKGYNYYSRSTIVNGEVESRYVRIEELGPHNTVKVLYEKLSAGRIE